MHHNIHPIDQKLAEMGVVLPTPPKAAANYLPYIVAGNLVQIAGQLPYQDGRLAVTGKLGATVSDVQGKEAARFCAINILAQLKSALNGDWSRLDHAVRLGVFVASTPDFTTQPAIANGASDFLVAVLGDAGRHARAAVGVTVLPFDAAVEIDALFLLK